MIDYQSIMDDSYVQSALVSTETVATLLQPPGDSWPIEENTIKSASFALQKFTQSTNGCRSRPTFLCSTGRN